MKLKTFLVAALLLGIGFGLLNTVRAGNAAHEPTYKVSDLLAGTVKSGTHVRLKAYAWFIGDNRGGMRQSHLYDYHSRTVEEKQRLEQAPTWYLLFDEQLYQGDITGIEERWTKGGIRAKFHSSIRPPLQAESAVSVSGVWKTDGDTPYLEISTLGHNQ